LSITIDSREGSAFLINHLPHGMVSVGRLEYGDVSFVGNGPNDEPILVGIERKALGDLINSITSGRFAGHQLPGLVSSYHVVYLIVEGLWRPGTTGLLEVRKGQGWEPLDRGRRWMWADVEAWLTTVEQKAGVRIRKTVGMGETAAMILALYRWWTSKEYDEHRAHLTLHKPPDSAALRKASLVRVMAAELPGIGWEKSERVAKRFRNVVEMVNAEEHEWREVEGVGNTIAHKIVMAVWGDGVRKVKERKP